MNVTATRLLHSEESTSHVGELFVTHIGQAQPIGVLPTNNPGAFKYTPILSEHQERLNLLVTTVEWVVYNVAHRMLPSPSLDDYEALIINVQSDVEACGLGALLRFWRAEVSISTVCDYWTNTSL